MSTKPSNMLIQGVSKSSKLVEILVLRPNHTEVWWVIRLEAIRVTKVDWINQNSYPFFFSFGTPDIYTSKRMLVFRSENRNDNNNCLTRKLNNCFNNTNIVTIMYAEGLKALCNRNVGPEIERQCDSEMHSLKKLTKWKSFHSNIYNTLRNRTRRTSYRNWWFETRNDLVDAWQKYASAIVSEWACKHVMKSELI